MKHRFARWVLFVAAAPVTLLLSGCSTVESRIADHPDIYHSLSARQQQLVANGQIAPGMPREAVYLAWGAPDQKVEGAMRPQMTETWIYVQYTTAYPYGYGYGYGYPYGYGGWGPAFGGGGVKALLFENPIIDGKPSAFPVAINTMGSRKRIAMALGVNEVADLTQEIQLILKAKPPTDLREGFALLKQGIHLLHARPKRVKEAACQ